MCLNLSIFASRNTAKRHITVAKVLIVPLNDEGTYGDQPFTPFQRLPIEFEKLYTSELVRDGWDIHQGLHSYADFADAHYVASQLANNCFNNNYYNRRLDARVFKAIIPKGSFYYFGKHGDVGASYASSQLIITDEVLGSIGKYDNVPFY